MGIMGGNDMGTGNPSEMVPGGVQTSPLEQYLLLGRGARGAAAVQLIHQVLEASGVYVFAELLEMQNISELKNTPEHKPHYDLLELFAYGVYGDYIRSAGKLPTLSPVMTTKLRHLTLVSLATGQKSLPLCTLSSQLGITATRELEDLIIEAIYADIIHGKLDQKNGILEVDYAIGRDIKSDDLQNIIATLQSWCDTCDNMLSNIDHQIVRANDEKESFIKHRNSLEQEVVNIKASLKSQAQDGDDSLVSDSRDHDKKRPAKKGLRASSSKFWPK